MMERIITSGCEDQLEEWQRTVIRDGDVLYIPAVIVGSEMEIFLCASYDGTSVMNHEDHLFVSIDWVLKEFSGREMVEDICATIKRRVKELEQ